MKDQLIGGKAANLKRLEELGFRVPRWMVFPVSLTDNSATTDSTALTRLADFFGPAHAEKSYAVRSSALDEDGSEHSHAGQFATYLHVPFAQLPECIEAVRRSAKSERVWAYRRERKLSEHTGVAVIVQEMLEPEVAGVAFGADPVTGDAEVCVISSVYGLGEGLVSGELDADTFTLRGDRIERNIIQKTHRFVRAAEGGISKEELPEQLSERATLSDELLQILARRLKTLELALGHPQDVEFAVCNGELFFLQTRPITTPLRGEYTLWDNSNIVESYPGITTPLTFSFILKMYEAVYRQFVGLLGVPSSKVDRHQEVFAQTLGLVRGRVYYNLLNWYKMLAMLPGYSINAGFMETMMGVTERFELDERYRMKQGTAVWQILKMSVRMLRLQVGLRPSRKRFQQHLNTTLDHYRRLDLTRLSVRELVEQYQNFEQNLLLKWRAPLVNDFFAMIWFGLLKKQCEQLCPERPNLHNDLLCGSQDIISTEPIRRTIALTRLIDEHPAARLLFTHRSAEEVWTGLSNGQFPEIHAPILEYLEAFGDRCIGELKLETIGYRQNPAEFIRTLQTYLERGLTKPGDDRVTRSLRTAAERDVFQALRGRPLRRRLFRLVLNRTRDLVSNRENLRYERTRGFGMVRHLFRALGQRLQEAGQLSDAEDIFYLELPEILALKNGFDPQLRDRICERRQRFESYREQAAPQARFFSYGNDFSDPYIYATDKLEPVTGDLTGVGCCPGVVEGRVRVVTDPRELNSLDGDILVTTSTDPGWVTLFPTCSALLVERGSLLSHSAIVAREMGIPCIVSIRQLLRTLKTDDRVRMDGSAGTIEILSAESVGVPLEQDRGFPARCD